MLSRYLIENDRAAFKWLALQVDDFIDLMPERYSDAQLLRFSYYNTSLKDGWGEVSSRFVQGEDGEALPVPDISLWLPGAALVLSAKALSALGKLLEGAGEVLPVNCAGELFYIFNCLSLVEADPGQSKQISDAGVVVGVEQIGFAPAAVEDSVIFKTRFDHCTGLYCNQEFKDKVEGAGLVGVRFNSALLPLF